MKIIEAMKKIKANRKKIADQQALIQKNCAFLSNETNAYGDLSAVKGKVDEWIQSCHDLSLECEKLLVDIARTNLATNVTIHIGGKDITKPIAAWIYRRREFAAIDTRTYQVLTDRGLKEGQIKNSSGDTFDVKINRAFDSSLRDKKLAEFSEEPYLIDSRLEVINAVTDLIEG
jgi:hypothetical protein